MISSILMEQIDIFGVFSFSLCCDLVSRNLANNRLYSEFCPRDMLYLSWVVFS